MLRVRKRPLRPGFTLIEVAVAAAIFAILSAIVVAIVYGSVGTTTKRVGDAAAALRELTSALNKFDTAAAGPLGCSTIGFRQVASNAVTSNSMTINKPAGVVIEDVMVAAIAVHTATIVITPPSSGGWTLVRRIDNTANTPTGSLAVYIKVAGGSEPADYTWTFSASGARAGGIQAYSGVDAITPINVDSGQTTPVGASHATPAVTTTAPNTRLVTSHMQPGVTGTWTPPTGMTERFDRNRDGAGAADVKIEGNEVAQAAVGSTGAKTATSSSNAEGGATHILALKPACTDASAGRLPLQISHLTNPITSTSSVNCPLCRNSCGFGPAPPAQSLYTATNATGWTTAPGPFYSRDVIPGVGFPLAIGFVQDTLIRTPATAAVTERSWGTLQVRINNVSYADALELDAVVDGDNSATTGTIRWTASPDAEGMLSSIFWTIPVGGC